MVLHLQITIQLKVTMLQTRTEPTESCNGNVNEVLHSAFIWHKINITPQSCLHLHKLYRYRKTFINMHAYHDFHCKVDHKIKHINTQQLHAPKNTISQQHYH